MLTLLPLALGLLLGSLTQVAIGRTDPRRAHGAMSLAFWAVVGLTLAIAAEVTGFGPGRRPRPK